MELNGFKDALLSKVSRLNKSEKELFDRIYTLWETEGRLVPPNSMLKWVKDVFGDVESVKKQDFIKITDKITYEGSIFNELRTMRPVVSDINLKELMELINSNTDGPFSNPLQLTPEDVFGRIKGKYCLTASNVAKYDGMHGLVIFNEHNPLNFTKEKVRDCFDVSKKWFKKAYESNNKAIYPFFTWNCLWKAGASVIHGHTQLALTEGSAYAKIEEFRHLTLRYQEEYRTNYFDDVYTIHKNIDLAFRRGNVRTIVKITPLKEKELMLLSTSFDDELADMVNDILCIYKDKLGVVSFNLIIILPPLTKTYEFWTHMPIIVKIVDRGSLTNKTTDMGSMEMYAQSIIGSNPYYVMDKLRAGLV